MPTLSASDYTNYIKFKSGAGTGIQRPIQTRDNVSLSQSVLNANILASQAAKLVTPNIGVVTSLARVRPAPPNNVNRPDARSTLSFAGTSGALSSSAYTRNGGLPTGFKNSQGSYTRLPQNAGWIQGGAENLSSGPKKF